MLCAHGGCGFSRPSVPRPYLPRDFGDFWAVPGAVPGSYRSGPRLIEGPSERQGTGTGWQRPKASQASRSIMRGIVRLDPSRLPCGPGGRPPERMGGGKSTLHLKPLVAAASRPYPGLLSFLTLRGRKLSDGRGEDWPREGTKGRKNRNGFLSTGGGVWPLMGEVETSGREAEPWARNHTNG